jgi:hypothetical protein
MSEQNDAAALLCWCGTKRFLSLLYDKLKSLKVLMKVCHSALEMGHKVKPQRYCQQCCLQSLVYRWSYYKSIFKGNIAKKVASEEK